ncbi:hypothetical protein HF086_007213 [Spodoptera exigua]|uniref:Uncharacterized protein n=1 Tax=Spodoptera exigua TaxID=7107 RepID=A0A922SM43_SPOEX|nr:hypothetical protein HF086_007213 [Spodoptera exigua]
MEGDLKSNFSSFSEGPPSALTWQTGVFRNVQLHDKCTIQDMLKMKEAFSEAYNNQMVAQEFRTALKTLLNVEYDDEEFKILFLKVTTVVEM